MAVRQITVPNLNASGRRGWCLEYVDNAFNSGARKYSARVAYDTELANGNIRRGEPPVGVYVPIWFDLTVGVYAGYDHVAIAYNHGNGVIEIWDSEVRSGVRGTYKSIVELERWFGNHGAKYLGWGVWCDGARIVEEYDDTPIKNPLAKSGTASVLVDGLRVRNTPSLGGDIIAVYNTGGKINYDSIVEGDGIRWISYVSYSGVRRYVACGKDGVEYLSGV